MHLQNIRHRTIPHLHRHIINLNITKDIMDIIMATKITMVIMGIMVPTHDNHQVHKKNRKE